jgi:hypothetical protein
MREDHTILDRDQRAPVLRSIARGAVVALMLVAATRPMQPASLALTAAGWETKGDARSLTDVAHPNGLLELGHSSATSKGLTFVDGTIDFDVRLTGSGILGIKFRDTGHRAAEVFYMRPQPSCPAAEDCIQYMPFENGAYEWDEYPEYQSKAPLNSNGWNHVRLVVSGRRMNVFINDATTPTLSVGRLARDARAGAISFSRPALYTNVDVRQAVTGGLIRRPQSDPSGADPRYIRVWRTAGPFKLASKDDPDLKVPIGVDPSYRDLPADPGAWSVTKAEDKGILDMSRVFGSSSQGSVIWMGENRNFIGPRSDSEGLVWLAARSLGVPERPQGLRGTESLRHPYQPRTGWSAFTG